MEYSNEKIKRLIQERDLKILALNKEIRDEIKKEKANYKFSWKRFLLFILMITLFISAVEINRRIFPKDSIWSWSYYKY